MSATAFRNYLQKIEKAYQTGNATAHTYNAALQELTRHSYHLLG